MANVFIPYEDGAGTKYYTTQEASVESALNDLCTALGITARVAPFGVGYTTLAALQGVSGWESAIPLPTALTPRTVSIGLYDDASIGTPGYLNTVKAIVGDEVTFAAIQPTGATPTGAAAAFTQMNGRVTAAAEESRSAN